ncbi:uncharacterized protein LOC122057992 [Macadamia integrifolia]|uniref:uncharacterized protein LOC122057992 n=1 Tax=Macadamia integrifolia TaxID=60698 RepID=UPI001C5340FE|nr:uncharacterized protein LOC122057992 [Macadamia integrifolia]
MLAREVTICSIFCTEGGSSQAQYYVSLLTLAHKDPSYKQEEENGGEKKRRRRRREGGEEKQEAVRLKSVAEEKYKLSKLKSSLKNAKKAQRLHPHLRGISELVTALDIIRIASSPSSFKDSTNHISALPDWYKILQVEPFSHINSIKKQYKKLALLLHPDKNTSVASEDAFKRVGEAFQVISDKIRRKEYDLKLRIALQYQATAPSTSSSVDTFWTACTTCRLFHQFERRYIGHRLMCPSCRKSFLAVQVPFGEPEDDEAAAVRVRASSARVPSSKNKEETGEEENIRTYVRRKHLRDVNLKRKMDSTDSSLEASDSKRLKSIGEMTLAEMQLESKMKANLKKMKAKEKMKDMDYSEGKQKKMTSERSVGSENGGLEITTVEGSESHGIHRHKMELRPKKAQDKKENERQDSSKTKYLVANSKKIKERTREKGNNEKEKPTERRLVSKSNGFEVLTENDSDFYDFDKDRMDHCFKKGQVWAVYDGDDDGMPRHYGLIDEVTSVYPFQVKMSWLNILNNGDAASICWENSGLHISCGRFKVARKTAFNSVNFFSHLVECERVAKEVYCIYPKKGSVWALYKGESLNGDESFLSRSNNRCYDIVVFLTSYSEIHGLSMAYLEKVEGFKTIFKRQEVGCHAIRWLEKDNVLLFSHQIPARKLSGIEAPDLPKDCWELDPASLPPDLLYVGLGS